MTRIVLAPGNMGEDEAGCAKRLPPDRLAGIQISSERFVSGRVCLRADLEPERGDRKVDVSLVVEAEVWGDAPGADVVGAYAATLLSSYSSTKSYRKCLREVRRCFEVRLHPI